MQTWKIEFIFVWLVLVAGLACNPHYNWTDIIGSVAVLISFGHAQVSDRMAEKQSKLAKPDVECYRWSLGYFIAKEALWLAYFISNHSYPALLGVVVFLLYPVWRKVYRRYVSRN